MSEKRILVTECSGECRNLRFVTRDHFFDDEDLEEGFYCAANLRGNWEKIDPKACEGCTRKYLTGQTREEVIDTMAKAMAADDVLREGYYEMAEKALDAILEKNT